MKECTTCNETKDLNQFYKQKKRSLGLMSQCKDCANKQQKKRRQYITTLVKRYKLRKGCEICGYKEHFAALQLDHLDPKEKERALSRMQTYNILRVKSEIRKCRVLCANCHAVHTYAQFYMAP